MKAINNVNELDGKEWLKHSINFYEFEKFDIEEIQKKFYECCYKKRTTGKVMLHNDKKKTNKYDFTFQYLKRFDEIQEALDIVYNSSYNSYHIILLDDVIDTDGRLQAKSITQYIIDNALEYRGKIIISCKKENNIKIALMILNRVENKQETKKIKEFRIELKKTSEYVINSKSKIDKIGLQHPAPYSYNDIEQIVQKENIKNKLILDPFLGVGSTILGTYKENTNIGIELNKEYIDLIEKRIEFLKPEGLTKEDYTIINGDSLKEIKKLDNNLDVVITSPPYFNILKNKSKGVRHDKSQARQGIEYYSECKDDIGNLDEYDSYLDTMTKIYKDSYKKLKKGGNFYLIISDFTIDKKETDIHSDMILCMKNAGFKYSGTSYILQNQKAIYPFGYPYKIVLNHIYQYIIKFTKED